MEALLVEHSSDDLIDQKWLRMFVLALIFHLMIFSIFFFIPESISTRRISGTVYEVNLVEMPAGKELGAKASVKAKTGKNVPSSKKAIPAKRIQKAKKKEKAVVIAKRVVKRKKRKKAKKPKVSPDKQIDRAVAKIKTKVKAEKKEDHIARAVSNVESQVKSEGEKGVVGGTGNIGFISNWWGMSVEEKIKSNWAYPVALASPKKQRDLEAIVVVKVKNDGTILKSWFKERSSNTVFDQSTMKAIERTETLPPFPPAYRQRYEEIEIRFNLEELLEF